jgi:hypothetical protein
MTIRSPSGLMFMRYLRVIGKWKQWFAAEGCKFCAPGEPCGKYKKINGLCKRRGGKPETVPAKIALE